MPFVFYDRWEVDEGFDGRLSQSARQVGRICRQRSHRRQSLGHWKGVATGLTRTSWRDFVRRSKPFFILNHFSPLFSASGCEKALQIGDPRQHRGLPGSWHEAQHFHPANYRRLRPSGHPPSRQLPLGCRQEVQGIAGRLLRTKRRQLYG